jgi:phage baseplate assembly protein W
MANGITDGINFPFRQSQVGKYLSLSETTEEEIRTDLVHLLLTRKGSRYYLPNFGTRLYEYIFEPLDGDTFDSIKTEIEESVKQFIPNLTIQNVLKDIGAINTLSNCLDQNSASVPVLFFGS